MKKDEKLDILFEDKYIIIVNKPAHLLTIATDKNEFNTLYRKVSTYVKKQNKNNKIFIVHRLDKETSGIIIFAKTQNVKYNLQNNWSNTKRYYIAIVEGFLKKDDTIKSYLKETKTNYTYSSKNKDGLLAITKYKILTSNKNYSKLEIEILTGRKNQIRVHMKDINHPIVGDKIYGSTKNPIRRLCLHASLIIFNHPVTKKEMKITCPIPTIFDNIIK